MKDNDKIVENQYDMVEDRYGIMRQRVTQKVVGVCKHHGYAKEEDLVDVTIKKTGKIVKRCKFCERDKFENKKVYTEDWKREKESLSDYYVRRTLVHGTKNALPMQDYPEILVEAKRAVIKLKRQTEIIKQPIKECSKHGKLYREDVIKAGKERSGNQKYKCKKCMKELHAKHYELHKVKVKLAHEQYKNKNKTQVAKSKAESYKKNKHKYLARENERKRIYDREATKLLKDRCIKKLLVKRTGLSMSDVPQELIETMRAVQLLKRGIKSHSLKKKIEDKKNVKD